MSKRKPLTPAEWKQTTFAPPTAEERLRQALEAKDRLSRSWATLLAPSMIRMCQARNFAISDALDWIEDTDEPCNIFEFSAFTRVRGNNVVEFAVRKAAS